MQLEDSIRSFITTNFYVADPQTLRAETSLLDSGIVDSTGVLEIIGFVEEQLGVPVDDTEMLPENLDSIGAIARFVSKKRG